MFGVVCLFERVEDELLNGRNFCGFVQKFDGRKVGFIEDNSQELVLNYLNFINVFFGCCGPDLVSVCNDRSYACFI